eukprot:1090196-Lingulodinium_polyedra.AAC.1
MPFACCSKAPNAFRKVKTALDKLGASKSRWKKPSSQDKVLQVVTDVRPCQRVVRRVHVLKELKSLVKHSEAVPPN